MRARVRNSNRIKTEREPVKIKTSEQMNANKMNMEEKRKIEKLINQEIDETTSALNHRHNREKEALQEKLNKNIPANIKALAETYRQAEKASEQAHETIRKAGYSVDRDRESNSIKVSVYSYGQYSPKELEALREKQSKEGARVLGLRKKFALKLFANSTGATELFEMLSKEIQAIIK